MKNLAQKYWDEDVREQMALQEPEPVPMTVRVQPEVKDRIHRLAEFLQKSQSQVAADLLEEASFEVAVHLAKIYDMTPEDANELLGKVAFMEGSDR